ncbi:hypothetical protein OIU85_004035 [Salix viminalis]|uniref:Uncharacterized protein n=1 Tax=Salix viminalis TaxID=40686 RepID=A0A9Q0PSI0_SALVM|nr:hypothetical protein OIU85_004035 [Salix viminalis]
MKFHSRNNQCSPNKGGRHQHAERQAFKLGKWRAAGDGENSVGYPLGWFSGARPSSKVRLRDSYSGLFAGFPLAMGRSERPQNNGGKGFGRLIGVRLVLLGCFLAIRLASSPAWAGFFRTGLFSALFS